MLMSSDRPWQRLLLCSAVLVLIAEVWTPAAVASTLAVETDLQLWLDAGQDVTTSGSGVTGWADQSGNNLNATPLAGSNAPELVTAAMNGQSVISFDAANSEALQPAAFSFGNDASVFIIYRDGGGNANANPGIYTWRQANFGMAFGSWSDFDIFQFRPRVIGKGALAKNSPGDTDTSKLGEAHYTNVPATSSSTADVGLNGSFTTHNDVDYESVPGSTMTRTIGKNVNGGYFNGDVAEIIQYTSKLNTAQRTITRNYLAAKYDVTLNATDVYTGDQAAQGDYDLNVIGIGRESDGEHITSRSAGLQLSVPSLGLDVGEYLMAGHKVASNGTTQDDLVGIGGVRWERVWYVDKTGSLDATLTFAFSEGGLTFPSGASFALLYSPVNAFSFSKLDVAPTIAGDQVSFSLGDSLLLDGYYTLNFIPEPTTVVLLALGGGLMLYHRRR